MDDKKMRRLRRLSLVPRWTIIPTIRKQNVAEHSFHVAWIALWLADYIGAIDAGKVDVGELLMTALEHDDEESITGDVPSVAKSKEIKSALLASKKDRGYGATTTNPIILNIIKGADILEALLFVLEEKHMGNASLQDVETDLTRNFYEWWKGMEWFRTGRSECQPYYKAVISHFSLILQLHIHPGLEYKYEL